MPRVVIQGADGTTPRDVVVDSAGHLQVDVLTLAEIRNALASVATDELRVTLVGADAYPTSPVVDHTIDTVVVTGSIVEVGAYTVTTNKTLYVTDVVVMCSHTAAAPEFMGWLQIAANEKVRGRAPAGGMIALHLQTPLKATSGQAVTINVYHFAGADRNFCATIIGYEV